MTRILDWAAPIVEHSEPGAWNDLDMLEASYIIESLSTTLTGVFLLGWQWRHDVR
jgi:hypothetical protein